MEVNLTNAFSQSLPEIKSMGMMLFDPIWAEQMHVSSGCELIYIIKGEMTLVKETSQHKAGPGEIIIVEPGITHRDDFDLEAGLEVFFLSFQWQHLDLFFQHVSNKTISSIAPLHRPELTSLFDQLRINLSQASEVDQLVARERLQSILLIILREAVNSNNQNRTQTNSDDTRKQRRQNLMKSAKNYLEKHFAKCIALNEIAADLNVSGYYLSHVFSEESDVSLFVYLTTIRIEKAKVFLAQGDLNVNQVAQAIGYETGNYFSKVFRRHCGISPKEYSSKYQSPK